MKKSVPLVGFVALLAICLVGFCGCGSVGGYEKAKSDIVSRIDDMNAMTDDLEPIVEKINADFLHAYEPVFYPPTFMQLMASTTDSQSYYDNFVNVDETTLSNLEARQDKLFGTSLRAAHAKGPEALEEQRSIAQEAVLDFSGKYNALRSVYDSLPDELDGFRDKYKGEHGDSVNAVIDYFRLSKHYAEGVLEPQFDKDAAKANDSLRETLDSHSVKCDRLEADLREL